MALPGNKNFSDYDNYITDPNPTTSAQAQDFFRNQAELLKAVIDCDFWQPETVYQPGDVVKSDSMPNGTEAVMVATKASVTSNVEPQWGNVGGANISDGACFWKLRWQHWSKEVEQITDLTTGATNRLPNTSYAVGNVVYNRSNLSVALKCTTAGTTSNTELDISANNIGDTITDGSVVWVVVKRDLTDEVKANADNFANYLDLDGSKAMRSPIDMLTIIGMRKMTNSESLQINGGKTYKEGACLILNGINSDNPSRFVLSSTDGTNFYSLVGLPNKRLTWNGNSVLTTQEIQQGKINNYSVTARQTRDVTITYKKPLKEAVFPKIWSGSDGAYHYAQISLHVLNPTTTGFTLRIENGDTTNEYYVDAYWEVIGEVAV